MAIESAMCNKRLTLREQNNHHQKLWGRIMWVEWVQQHRNYYNQFNIMQTCCVCCYLAVCVDVSMQSLPCHNNKIISHNKELFITQEYCRCMCRKFSTPKSYCCRCYVNIVMSFSRKKNSYRHMAYKSFFSLNF